MNEVNLDPTALGMNPFADLTEDINDKPEGFESPLSPNIYDKAPDSRLVPFIEGLIGVDNNKALLYMANQRGVEQLTCLRQLIAYAFLDGSFDCTLTDPKTGAPLPVSADDKRSGNDNNPKFTTNMQIRGVIRQHNYGLLVSAGNALAISNIAALQRGLAVVLKTKDVLRLIDDSEKAMKALERKF